MGQSATVVGTFLALSFIPVARNTDELGACSWYTYAAPIGSHPKSVLERWQPSLIGLWLG